MQLKELLNEFAGLDAEGVAEKLRQEGIKGVKKSCTNCPMANWLKKYDVDDPSVGDAVVSGFVGVEKVYQLLVGQQLPKGVKEFVAKFDDGWFDELEDKSKAMME
jgi:hypothetical protein